MSGFDKALREDELSPVFGALDILSESGDFGVVPTVAKNIAIQQGAEDALTYLLGALDTIANQPGDRERYEALRACRNRIKELVR